MKTAVVVIVSSIILCVIVGGIISHSSSEDEMIISRLEFSLALDELPEGVHLVAFAEDTWTDEVLHFVIDLDDGVITNLLSGRDYEKKTTTPKKRTFTGYTNHLPEFEVAHYYTAEGSALFGCWVETDINETRAYVMYAAD